MQIINRQLSVFGFSTEQQYRIYEVLAAILHIGNLCFEVTPSGAYRIIQQIDVISISRLLKINADDLCRALLFRDIPDRGTRKNDSILLVYYHFQQRNYFVILYSIF